MGARSATYQNNVQKILIWSNQSLTVITQCPDGSALGANMIWVWALLEIYSDQ